VAGRKKSLAAGVRKTLTDTRCIFVSSNNNKKKRDMKTAKKIAFGMDRLQLMVERVLEDRYEKCLYERKPGEILMRDPKVGTVKVKVALDGCQVAPIVSNAGIWRVWAWSCALLLVLGLIVVAIQPLMFLLLGTSVVSVAMRRVWELMKQQQRVEHFALQVAYHLEHSLQQA
jgi:hypothetical protein